MRGPSSGHMFHPLRLTARRVARAYRCSPRVRRACERRTSPASCPATDQADRPCLAGGPGFRLRARQPLVVAAMEVVPPGLKVEAVVTTPTISIQDPRMDIHQNARTTARSRMLIVHRLGLRLVS